MLIIIVRLERQTPDLFSGIDSLIIDSRLFLFLVLWLHIKHVKNALTNSSPTISSFFSHIFVHRSWMLLSCFFFLSRCFILFNAVSRVINSTSKEAVVSLCVRLLMTFDLSLRRNAVSAVGAA